MKGDTDTPQKQFLEMEVQGKLFFLDQWQEGRDDKVTFKSDSAN